MPNRNVPCRSRRALVAAALFLTALHTAPALAQGRGCAVTTLTDPPREVLRCGGGLVIEAERGAGYRLLDTDRDGRPDGARLDSGALLVDLPPGRRRSFQILTPHAVASVRGTIWATDVTSMRTSVLVSEGRVGVERAATRESVVLGPGEGVDVQAGNPLVARRWGAERAAGLMARFGR